VGRNKRSAKQKIFPLLEQILKKFYFTRFEQVMEKKVPTWKYTVNMKL
jgi:hypothetical protein